MNDKETIKEAEEKFPYSKNGDSYTYPSEAVVKIKRQVFIETTLAERQRTKALVEALQEILDGSGNVFWAKDIANEALTLYNQSNETVKT